VGEELAVDVGPIVGPVLSTYFKGVREKEREKEKEKEKWKERMRISFSLFPSPFSLFLCYLGYPN